MGLRALIWVTAFAVAAPAFADGGAARPKPHHKLHGRDVAVLLALPFSLFALPAADEKPATSTKKREGRARP